MKVRWTIGPFNGLRDGQPLVAVPSRLARSSEGSAIPSSRYSLQTGLLLEVIEGP